MIWLALRTWTMVCLVAGMWGCAAMVPERKVPLEKSRIQEEDITEGQSRGAEEPGRVQPETSPGFQPESPVQPIEPGARPPRRLKFRDRGFDPRDDLNRNAGTIGTRDCLSKRYCRIWSGVVRSACRAEKWWRPSGATSGC